jgi:hypothetical protein
MKQTKIKAYLPLNHYKINTNRKIRKLKKIKKRKIKFPGIPLANCNCGAKKLEDKTKKNESNLGNNSTQIINGDKMKLPQDINISNNRCDNILTNKQDYNTNDTINNMILLDGNFPNNKGFLPLPIIVAIPVFCSASNNFNFEFLNDNNSISNSSFHNNLEIENHNNNHFNTAFFGGDNRNEFYVENPTNKGNNNSFYNINNSNRYEINPQNNNSNNNNQSNNKINLRPNVSEFYFDYPRTNQNNNQLNIRPNVSEFYFDYPRTNQNNNQLNLRTNDSEFYFDYPRLRNRTNAIPNPNPNPISNTIENIKNKLIKIRYQKSLSSNENRESCIICSEDFKNNQKVYSLPCSHLFHVQCLNREIKYRQKCPMCRALL